MKQAPWWTSVQNFNPRYSFFTENQLSLMSVSNENSIFSNLATLILEIARWRNETKWSTHYYAHVCQILALSDHLWQSSGFSFGFFQSEKPYFPVWQPCFWKYVSDVKEWNDGRSILHILAEFQLSMSNRKKIATNFDDFWPKMHIFPSGNPIFENWSVT